MFRCLAIDDIIIAISVHVYYSRDVGKDIPLPQNVLVV